jgi:hypothetical protein
MWAHDGCSTLVLLWILPSPIQLSHQQGLISDILVSTTHRTHLQTTIILGVNVLLQSVCHHQIQNLCPPVSKPIPTLLIFYKKTSCTQGLRKKGCRKWPRDQRKKAVHFRSHRRYTSSLCHPETPPPLPTSALLIALSRCMSIKQVLILFLLHGRVKVAHHSSHSLGGKKLTDEAEPGKDWK